MTHGPQRWRKSSYSSSSGNCVEVAADLAHLRDSKNTAGPTLHVDTAALIAAIKTGDLAEPHPFG